MRIKLLTWRTDEMGSFRLARNSPNSVSSCGLDSSGYALTKLPAATHAVSRTGLESDGGVKLLSVQCVAISGPQPQDKSKYSNPKLRELSGGS